MTEYVYSTVNKMYYCRAEAEAKDAAGRLHLCGNSAEPFRWELLIALTGQVPTEAPALGLRVYHLASLEAVICPGSHQGNCELF